MTTARVRLTALIVSVCGLSFVWACAFDDNLREYLSAEFWLPFAKSAYSFAAAGVPRVFQPYAGMETADDNTPLGRLRAAYQQIAFPDEWPAVAPPPDDFEEAESALEAARSQPALTRKQKEEIELLAAKIDMRRGSRGKPEPLQASRAKLLAFLRDAHTPEYRSEARGWLARVYYLLGDQAAAGKIYLDELNQRGSNLSQQTLVNSLRLTYGYDGGERLVEQLSEYFDTPEHAAFAITLATNPKWTRQLLRDENQPPPVTDPPPDERIRTLLLEHADLFRSHHGSEVLAVLGMRTGLRAGDPGAALKIAANVPERARIRKDPDFLWMLGSGHFLTRDYLGAEKPLVELFSSSRASYSQRAAAAYGLCGVYQKTRNAVEQIRMALWLRVEAQRRLRNLDVPGNIQDQGVYWASSGWDLGLLLDSEAPIEAMRSFVEKYPAAGDVRLVKYALAVRLARENRYAAAAQIYSAIAVPRRAERMRRMAELYAAATRTGVSSAEQLDAKYALAHFLADHSTGIYWNDKLWHGLQRYALFASSESRVTGEERRSLIERERQLKDDQEEYWRAYLLLWDVMHESGDTDLGRRARALALRCLRRITTDRFGRENEIRAADITLSRGIVPREPAPLDR